MVLSAVHEVRVLPLAHARRRSVDAVCVRGVRAQLARPEKPFVLRVKQNVLEALQARCIAARTDVCVRGVRVWHLWAGNKGPRTCPCVRC